MKAIRAIAQIAIRNAVRSRVVVVLLGMLMLAVVGLPLTVTGDGTIAGKVQILLRYTLWAATAILSIATIWAGCAAVSLEIQERQIHLIVTKPVHRWQIWLGKWCGIMFLNALLLVVVGVSTGALLRWNTRSEALSPRDQKVVSDELLVARRVIAPEPVDLESMARKIFDTRQKQGELPNGVSPDQILEASRQMAISQLFSVPSGSIHRWTFRIPAGTPKDRPLLLRYKFFSGQPDKQKVEGYWTVGGQDSPDRFEVRAMDAPEGVHTLEAPAQAIAADGTLLVAFANIHSVPVTLFFPPDDGLQLLVQTGGFEMNLARSLLVILCQLGFLTALALTAGSLFSLPVAALLSGNALFLLQVGPYLRQLVSAKTYFSGEEGAGLGILIFDGILRAIYLTLNALVQPLQSADPFEPLASGQLVSWFWVGSAVLFHVVLGAGLLGLLGAWLLNRREIAIPD